MDHSAKRISIPGNSNFLSCKRFIADKLQLYIFSGCKKLVPCGRRRGGTKIHKLSYAAAGMMESIESKCNCRYVQGERKCDIHTGDVVDRPATRQNIFLRKASISVDSCGSSSFTRSVVLWASTLQDLAIKKSILEKYWWCSVRLLWNSYYTRIYHQIVSQFFSSCCSFRIKRFW